MWDDIQQLFTQHQQDVTAISKQCAELAAKMITKKDFNETKSKVNALTSRG
jgi:hypothetical protein